MSSGERWGEYMANADASYRRALAGDDRGLAHHNALKDGAEEIRLLRALARLSSGRARLEGRALDVGCGSGYMTRCLADAGFTAEGLDLSEAGVRLARERYPGLEFRVADGAEPAFPPDVRYDLVLFRAFHPFFRLDEPDLQWEILSRYLRVLSPSGAAAIMNPAVKPSLDYSALRPRLEAAGWELIGPYYLQAHKLFRAGPSGRADACLFSSASKFVGRVLRRSFGHTALIVRKGTA